jgi:hypothetical protein
MPLVEFAALCEVTPNINSKIHRKERRKFVPLNNPGAAGQSRSVHWEPAAASSLRFRRSIGHNTWVSGTSGVVAPSLEHYPRVVARS